MNIKELKEIIEDLDDNVLVVVSCDSEGNGYSEATGCSTRYNYSDGEIGFSKLTAKDKKEGYGEGDLLKDGDPAFVLWP